MARKSLLEEQGYVITTATNGEEAFEALSNTPFDLMITDFRMPKMNGIELIRQAKASQPKLAHHSACRVSSIHWAWMRSRPARTSVIAKGNNEVANLLRARCACSPEKWPEGPRLAKGFAIHAEKQVQFGLNRAEGSLPIARMRCSGCQRFSEPPSRLKSSLFAAGCSTLTLSQKVAQLVVIPFYGEAPNTRSKQYRRFLHLVRDERVGGLILVNRSNGRGIQRAEPYALAAFVNRMQRLARIPLIVAGDFERGASMRVNGTTLFPHAMAFARGRRSGGDEVHGRGHGPRRAGARRAVGLLSGGRRQQQSG